MFVWTTFPHSMDIYSCYLSRKEIDLQESCFYTVQKYSNSDAKKNVKKIE